MKIIKIYTLSDISGVKYVGKASDVKKRYYRHIFDAKNKSKLNKRDAWVKSLLNKNEKPILEIIDEVPIEEWEFWECYWISQFKTWGFDLKNMTNGGEGTYGRIVSDKTKLKMSLTKKGKLPKNMASLHMLSIKGNVLQYNLNGKLIKEWESVNKAKNELKIKNINLVVNGKRDVAGGYIWRYKSKPLTKTELKKINENKLKQKPKIVQQLTMDGVLIKEWSSVNEVKKIYKHINSVLNNKRKSAGGYRWKYK